MGVSPDEPPANKAFAEKFKFPFPLLSDPSKAMMTKYGAWGEKKMYGIPMTGVIRSTVWIGPDGVVKKHWKKVPDAAAHPAKVLEALQSGP